MHRLVVASLAVAGLSVGLTVAASAADLSRPAPVYTKAPLIAPFSWSGFYVGVNGGYGWSSGNDDITYTSPLTAFAATSQGFDSKGGFGGAQLGYNWQFSQIVLGLETDFEGSGIHDAFNVTVPSNSGPLGVDASQKLDYFGTVRGRLGYAFDRALVYATGGFAYGDVKDSISLTNQGVPALLANSHVDTGFVLGGGIEYSFAPAWSVKAEYQFIDLKNETLTGVSGNNVPLTTNAINDRFQTVRAGVNYKLGGN